MATTTTPEVKPAETKKAPISLTANAVTKVKEIMAQQNPVPAGLRVGVVGGGCSGFSYSMQFDNGAGMMDKVFDMDGLKVYVDATSVMYLNGCVVDYVESLEGAGFKFENPKAPRSWRGFSFLQEWAPTPALRPNLTASGTSSSPRRIRRSFREQPYS